MGYLFTRSVKEPENTNGLLALIVDAVVLKSNVVPVFWFLVSVDLKINVV